MSKKETEKKQKSKKTCSKAQVAMSGSKTKAQIAGMSGSKTKAQVASMPGGSKTPKEEKVQQKAKETTTM